MKKKLTRLFSVLLAAVLVLGTLPVSAMGTDVADPPASAVDDTPAEVSAAEPEEASVVDETPDGEKAQSGEVEAAATYASADVQYKIVHLDCGRKYFSKDWIIALLYEMQNDGYNQLQLAFGNDGLRFLLDDMSFTANGTEYSHQTVVSKVEAGNEAQNNSGDPSYLTETEMNEIIDTAKTLDIEIVPLLNLPGHANAILDIADDAYNESGSNNTLDVANSDVAREFGKAIFVKYVDYFAGKGCKFFNFGADEYANDATGAFSFSRLNSTQYQAFVSFINDLAGYVISKNMTPRAFNDGFYYNGQNMDVCGNLNNTQVCYWSSGWPSYPVASASTISGKCHAMINTNGDFYYVLGKDDKFDSDYSFASNFTNSGFMGSTISKPVGSMFCIWCDYPNAETETKVAQKTRLVLRAMAQRMDNQTVSVSDNVVANGFNADGTINNTVDDSLIKISVGDSTEAATSGELTVDGTMTLKANKQVDWTTSDASVASIAASDPEAVMAAAETGAVNATAITVTAKKAGSATITATAGNKSATYAVTVNDPGMQTVTVTVGGTYTLEDVDGAYNGDLLPGDPVATVTGVSETQTGSQYYNRVTSTSIPSGDYFVSPYSSTYYVDSYGAKLTVEQKDGNYYIKNGAGKYIYPSYNGLIESDEPGAVSLTSYTQQQNVKYFVIASGRYYLHLDNNKTFSSQAYSQSMYFFEYTGKTTSTITFTGNSVGTTYVTIGDTKYKITVSPTPLTIEYWVTNSKVTADGAFSKTINITDENVNTENGAAISDLVPENGIHDGHPTVFKQARMLDAKKDNSSTSGSGTELQTDVAGDDETESGEKFTRIRYWNNKWQVYTTKNEWIDVNTTQVSVNYKKGEQTLTYTGTQSQLVAYHMQHTTITEEITTYVTDWGNNVGEVIWHPYDYVELDFAVKYENGLRTPNAFPVAGTTSGTTKTMEFHAHSDTTDGDGFKHRRIGRIDAIETSEYEVYMITLTPTSDDRNEILSSGPIDRPESYEYKGTEKVVWVDDVANLGDFEDTRKQAPQFHAGGDPTIEYVNIYSRQGMLVTYYVRTKPTQDALTVYYVDEDTGVAIYDYSIAVKQGTTFNSEIALDSQNKKGPLVNGTVQNLQGHDITVSADLSTMPAIQAGYRYADYDCTRIERSEDGKTLTLYYNISTSVSFVVDFGAPLNISLADVNETLATQSDGITSVVISGVTHGTAKLNDDDKSITYTPDSRFTSSKTGEQMTVTYSGKNSDGTEGGISYTFYIYPASNVLYEEGFLTGADGWTDASVAHTDPQQTQKVGDSDKNVFGYDGSYARATNNNGVWEATELNTSALTKPLTTNFYGNTFDLIGNCAPDSGRVIMVIKGDDGKGRAVDVDTRYSSETIYQVPLAHVVMGDTDKNYSVMIYASGLASKTDTDTAPRGVATMSIDDANMEADDLLTQVLEENGLSMDDVEYVSVSAMDNANVVTADDSDDAVAIYANDAKATAYQSGTHVEIDGFRVYRSTNDDVASNYPTNEKNVDYKRILDVVKGEITAYSDKNGQLTINVQQYEANGGPQNEIYLANGQSVVFQSNDLVNKEVQVSLRAVNADATASVAGTQISLASNTEMYYTLKADATGTVTIANNETDLLAIGNVKLPKSVTTDSIQSASEAGDEAVITALKSVLYTDEEPEVFTPETFTAKTTVTPVVRNKMVTLKVNVSSDVAYITVNGVKYTRTGLQGLFRKTRTIRVVNTVKKGQTKTYEVVAYNADGVASETITVTG